jgi:kynurenine formamidase
VNETAAKRPLEEQEAPLQVIDLSHTAAHDMPVYPETEPPRFRKACTIAQHGLAETELTFFSHVGTHIDGPAHILPEGPTLDTLPTERFIGPGCVLDVANPERKTIEVDHLKADEERIAQAQFVLLHTGWSRYWRRAEYFEGFPTLSVDAAHWLAAFPLKGIGIDAISADGVDTEGFPVHKVFLEEGIVIVENLTGLERLATRVFEFICLPLKFEEADGAPTRAVAVCQQTWGE